MTKYCRFYIMLLCCLLVQLSVPAQNKQLIDSLYHELVLVENNKTKIDLLNQLARLTLIISRNNSEDYANQAIKLSDEINYQKGKANAYDNLGHNFYYWEENLAKASGFYHKALVIREEINDYTGIATTYNNLGNIKLLQGDYEKAQEYYLKNIELNQKYPCQECIFSYSNLAAICVNRNQFRKAIIYTDSSIKLSNKIDAELSLSIDYTRLGNIYKNLAIADSALFWYNKGLELRKQIKDSSGIVYINNMIAQLLVQQQKYDSAKILIEEILNYEKHFSSHYQQFYAHQSLSIIFEHFGNYKKANEANKLLVQLKDSIYHQENNREIAEIESNYLLKKDRELRRLHESKKNLQNYLIILGLLFVLLFLFLLFNRNRLKARSAILEKENVKLQKAKLESELDLKQKELITNIMKLAEKNEVIQQVVLKLKKQSLHFKKENQKLIQEIINSIESTASEDIWKRFENTFMKLHKDFYTNLEKEHQALTPNEKRLCAFLKMNLSSKEIASLTHMPTTSIETARVRLRKKLNLSNTKTSLIEYLSGF